MPRKAKEKEKLICAACQKEKDKESGFYNSRSSLYEKTGKVPICKTCLKKNIDYSNIESIYTVLQQIDVKFDPLYWEQAEKRKTDTFSAYMTMANSLKQFNGTGYKDSIFTKEDKTNVTANEEESQTSQDIDSDYLEKLKEKYGYGYPDDDYLLFEKKFLQLKPSFQLLTTMHEECLREYCVNKVYETLAKAKGDFKQAKDWAAMAKDTAEAGKLKPSQMSKADLSQGLDGFGQLARMVEEKVDIIPILPKFVSQPKDKPDVVLWCYLNYVRDLKGLPPADYKDIYNFYEERRADYEKQELDNDPSMREL
ncbi:MULTISPECIES: hypothetical protein [Bacillus amyloliquefaciens group]|uniref:hypothetical protein n=1 Tax=Bacillus amyloliquefaciens group TaxID=1938374 RepID=UPI0006247FE3|nr:MULTISPECIES: hypothetical protein [Bacillus amyloliquefaciens group]AKF31038.1 hypothetical protein AAV29_10960 [Bacillus velezensis]ATC49430.1 hypothetical protein CLI97_00093 [Bacillus velezensis]MDH3075761.1 hypothetical protein [Bacillus velezensis]MDH3107102.1 hypothetical protein [Bacillus velezensis]MDH3135697.1 hypothetical protein [Bacillus velezensis]